MHTDTFKPPDSSDQPDAKEMFGFVAGLFYLFIMTLSAFWALLARKSGTLGTRAYWFDFLCGNTLLLFLRQSFPSPNYELFTWALIAMPVLFVWHISRTLSRKEHVHTHCIGTPWIGGPHGEVWECLAGLCVGGGFVFAGAQPFGAFVATSAAALAIRAVMVKERDRQRSVQMDDALWEQDYMMRNYDRWKKANHEQAQGVSGVLRSGLRSTTSANGETKNRCRSRGSYGTHWSR